MSETEAARSLGALYLADAIQRFQEAKAQADGAVAQVPFAPWQGRLDPGSNSLATLVLHVAGNQVSRWTDFLTTDGEMFDALSRLREEDLVRTVRIRTRPLVVVPAINRQLAHYAQHVGQMVFLARHLAGHGWRTLSIPRGGSATFDAAMASRPHR